jgi:predicted ATP-grasp superfamily ATP-dependent carboligase
MGQRFSDIFGLDELISINSILSCDYGVDGEQYEQSHKVAVVSTEKATGTRDNWSNFSLQTLVNSSNEDDVIKILSNCKFLIPYASVDSLFDLSRRELPHLAYLGILPKLKNVLDNKFFFRNLVSQIGINVVPGFTTLLIEDKQFDIICKQLGFPFVAQASIGSSGSGTYCIDSNYQWNDLFAKYRGQDILFTKYIHGPSLNINAVVKDENIVLSYPSVQILGVPELSDKTMTYCGNDYAISLSLDPTLVKKTYELTKLIGGTLREMGYRGIFGIDFISDDSGNLFPVELNPRFQGSTQLLTNLQINCGETPLSIEHILAFSPDAVKSLNGTFSEPSKLSGSQIILHNLRNSSIEVPGNISAGVYSFDEGIYKYKRPGFTIRDCNNSNEILVSCAVPPPGLIIRPGAPLLKIQSTSSMYNLVENRLTPQIVKFIKEISNQFVPA